MAATSPRLTSSTGSAVSFFGLWNVQFVAALEIANVLFHPIPGLLALFELDGIDDLALCCLNARTSLRHAIDDSRQRGYQQQVERRLRECQHLVAAGGGNRGEKIHDGGNGRGGVGDLTVE